jgi:hypothetical protein
MTEQLRKSTQKARFESHINEGEGTKGHRRGVQYTRLDGEKAPQAGSKAVKLVSQFTAEEAEVIKKLKPGDEFVVEKVENKWTKPDGSEGTSWNLSTVRDVSTWVEPAAKKPWDGNKNSFAKKEWKDNGPASKVGGLYHDAATLLAQRNDITELSTDFIASKMAELVRAMVKDAMAIEKEITSGEKSVSSSLAMSNSKASSKDFPKAKLESADEPDFFSGLDAVEF